MKSPPPLPASAPFKLPKVIGAEVAGAFADRIIFLHWPPGTRLIEEDLCAVFGVSRSPVREAFQMLEADGLIVRAAWRGVRVSPMNQKDLDEVYKCRGALEGLVAEEAARIAEPAGIARLALLLEQMRAAREAGDVRAFFDHNVAFTRAVHTASGNNTLVRMVSGIEKQALRYRYLAHQRTQEMQALAYDGHAGVLDAMAAGKADLARRRAVRMIRYAHRVIARVLGDDATQAWLAEDRSAQPAAP